ncbi:MAG: HD domain-containing protein [bacterium]|nr:HD domain-containing protein [bacterium]
MHIRKRLIVLILSTTILFLIALLVMNFAEQERRDLLFNDFVASREQFFDKVLMLKSASLATFAYDYTYWDEMVTFVEKENKKWAKQNIDASLSTYDTDAVWIYNRDWKLVYFVSREGSEINNQLPLPRTLYPRLFAQGPFCHFFINTATGLLEVNGASIHPTVDQERRNPAQGYFFVGRIWSSVRMKELAELTGNTLTLVPVQFQPDVENIARDSMLQESKKSVSQTRIVFSRVLKGWDDRPVMRLIAQSESPIMKVYLQGAKREFVILFGFSLAMLFLLMVFLTRWISQPLRLITQSLNAQNPELVKPLQNTSTEFGHIARLINLFFIQRNTLQENQRMLSTLISNLPGMVYRCRNDRNWTMEFVSDGCYPLTGYQPNELINNNRISYAELIHPDDREEVWNKVQSSIQNTTSFQISYRIITATQQEKWVWEQGRGVYSDRGELLALEGFITDITAHRAAEEERQQGYQRLRRAMGGTISALASATELRDPYTAGHQRRVANLARAIATEMGLTKDQIEGIRIAATVHDIGKIYVPAEILTKPTKLTEVEFDLIKTHPQGGYDILKDIEFPWPIAEIVVQHHERLNGSGYPRKLTADRILLEARIIAVADVVEAMATHRPYRPALSINEALAEIDRHRIDLYDSTVVDACIRLFTEKNFKLE